MAIAAVAIAAVAIAAVAIAVATVATEKARREPKIPELHICLHGAVGEEDVGRLEVAMEDVMRMYPHECREQLREPAHNDHDGKGGGRGEVRVGSCCLSLPPNGLRQSAAHGVVGDKLHVVSREEACPKADDVWVAMQAGESLCLSLYAHKLPLVHARRWHPFRHRVLARRWVV